MIAADRSPWLWGAGVALAAHMGLLAAVLLTGMGEEKPVIEDPIVLVELPSQAAAAPAPALSSQPVETVRKDAITPQNDQPRIEAPQIRAPLPREFVTTPPPIVATASQRIAVADPRPAQAPAPQTPQAVAPEGADTGTAQTKGDDPKAKREEADYYTQLSAHLNRKKHYPSEAKKARQQGVVTVRFTVHANGTISAASIRNSSGHALLDQATLELMERVSPLPKFPRSMTKSSVTISLPIDYSLRTR